MRCTIFCSIGRLFVSIFSFDKSLIDFVFFFIKFYGGKDMRDAKRALAEGQSPYAELYRAGKVCTRAKKTLEKAKDCISKELVWKVIRCS